MLTVALKEMPDKDTILDCESRGKNKDVFYYEPIGSIVISVEAGSSSCFDNSEELRFYKEYDTPVELSGITRIIQEENERIMRNVNPKADHNFQTKQMADARMNAFTSNS